MAKINCPKCGEQLDETAICCTHCGEFIDGHDDLVSMISGIMVHSKACKIINWVLKISKIVLYWVLVPVVFAVAFLLSLLFSGALFSCIGIIINSLSGGSLFDGVDISTIGYQIIYSLLSAAAVMSFFMPIYRFFVGTPILNLVQPIFIYKALRERNFNKKATFDILGNSYFVANKKMLVNTQIAYAYTYLLYPFLENNEKDKRETVTVNVLTIVLDYASKFWDILFFPVLVLMWNTLLALGFTAPSIFGIEAFKFPAIVWVIVYVLIWLVFLVLEAVLNKITEKILEKQLARWRQSL